MPNPLEWAWAAGIVDGEGSFFILHKRRGEFVPTLKVSMSHEETIMKLKRIFRATLPIYRDKRPGNKAMFCLSMTGEKAFEVTRMLQPYLVTKRQQAALMIEYAEKCHKGNGNQEVSIELQADREIIREELQELNKRGE